MSTTQERPSGRIIVRRAPSSRASVVHLPADTEDPEPLCGQSQSAVEKTNSGNKYSGEGGFWLERDWSIYPNRELCEKCRQQRGDA